ncbi:glucose-1-phosphate thymidylyltransferase [Thermocatellispora tengchongensis]|uniref:Glucose-1-phosphate thymidylyltransferase n=1 Tax=Thermocatellispora tengchongensis TaxID=1073253 RepID=A0A840PDV8_9ACTN|nr:glucose-1-phosphate thymidylyltransferase RfbA [Thermocatellispora tengchongensis]MBB5136031.1 glucose-1-phosphate thymidylyltransferase [Thermocatellispora tengchongensis]
MKGIVLAGGNGKRLHPLTLGTSKQLLPIYDKPMIYYPLSTLMLAGIRDILVISTPSALPALAALLGDGSHLGIALSYAEQAEPRGVADGILVGGAHVGDGPVALVLGDNLFHGAGFSEVLKAAKRNLDGCTLFGYPVKDPDRYGVAELDESGAIISVEEKPLAPRSDNAITGLYFYDGQVVEIARSIKPSARGELEITDVNRVYVEQRRAHLVKLGRGFTWLDAGTHESLLEASQYVQILESRQGIRVACLEEIALRLGFIDADTCYKRGHEMRDSSYGRYVMETAMAFA